MRLYPVIHATMPEGAERRWFGGAEDTIQESKPAIRTALAEARLAGGTDLRIAFVEPGSERMRYRYRYRVKPP